MNRLRLKVLALAFALAVTSLPALGADLVRIVRNKLSAADLQSGIAAVEDYRNTTGVDEEYLNAVGWLARGGVMLNQFDLADTYLAELRREIPKEKAELIVPFGAAIEVDAKLRNAREGRGAALRYLQEELSQATDPALRSRINKNVNLLSLEGELAPPLVGSDLIGAPAPELTSMKGRPVLLFLWASWCGDCKAQAASLTKVWEKYRAKGLTIVAPTRYYGSVGDKDATPAEERQEVARVWKESYPGLESVPVVIDNETMIRYGASATPTFVLIDRKGLVRLYAPTRLSEAELSRRIETVLAEAP